MSSTTNFTRPVRNELRDKLNITFRLDPGSSSLSSPYLHQHVDGYCGDTIVRLDAGPITSSDDIEQVRDDLEKWIHEVRMDGLTHGITVQVIAPGGAVMVERVVAPADDAEILEDRFGITTAMPALDLLVQPKYDRATDTVRFDLNVDSDSLTFRVLLSAIHLWAGQVEIDGFSESFPVEVFAYNVDEFVQRVIVDLIIVERDDMPYVPHSGGPATDGLSYFVNEQAVELKPLLPEWVERAAHAHATNGQGF